MKESHCMQFRFSSTRVHRLWVAGLVLFLTFFGAMILAAQTPTALQFSSDVTAAGTVVESAGVRVSLAEASRLALSLDGSIGAILYSNTTVEFRLDPEKYPDSYLGGRFSADNSILRAGSYGDAGLSLIHSGISSKDKQGNTFFRLELGAGAGVLAALWPEPFSYEPSANEYERFERLILGSDSISSEEYQADDFTFIRGGGRGPGFMPYGTVFINYSLSTYWYIEADIKAFAKYGSVGITLGRRLR